MISHSSTYTKLAILLLYLLQTIHCRPQDTEANGSPINPLRNGRYIPELHGADRGKYIPDESGKYHHVKVPYNGGYGDRGQMYVHDARGLPLHQFGTLNGFQLGPKDHLRFSVDFNFDGSGWQIVQFEWINDDDVKKHYDYKYENQLWPSDYDVNADANADVEATATEKPEEGDTTNVHVSGEYQDDIYNVKYTNDNELNAPSQFNIQATISDVLDYVQTNVLPTLT
ncbi:uncharacterized protein LOC120772814 isoform X2 [Bactrocera tryoni]|uniref:uncharacterized protein LOC120772814 isoform X2 n=1 Tax=Bactrocera tryoni TaxID=59916 RepID=UPI001A96EAC1|nr:uncharacterized protein LOC120772814 isoform X2 [Bactrocera tryoni]